MADDKDKIPKGKGKAPSPPASSHGSPASSSPTPSGGSSSSRVSSPNSGGSPSSTGSSSSAPNKDPESGKTTTSWWDKVLPSRPWDLMPYAVGTSNYLCAQLGAYNMPSSQLLRIVQQAITITFLATTYTLRKCVNLYYDTQTAEELKTNLAKNQITDFGQLIKESKRLTPHQKRRYEELQSQARIVGVAAAEKANKNGMSTVYITSLTVLLSAFIDMAFMLAAAFDEENRNTFLIATLSTAVATVGLCLMRLSTGAKMSKIVKAAIAETERSGANIEGIFYGEQAALEQELAGDADLQLPTAPGRPTDVIDYNGIIEANRIVADEKDDPKAQAAAREAASKSKTTRSIVEQETDMVASNPVAQIKGEKLAEQTATEKEGGSRGRKARAEAAQGRGRTISRLDPSLKEKQLPPSTPPPVRPDKAAAATSTAAEKTGPSSRVTVTNAKDKIYKSEKLIELDEISPKTPDKDDNDQAEQQTPDSPPRSPKP